MDLLTDYKYQSYISDIKWAYNNGKYTRTRGNKEMKSLIMNAPRVKSVIEELVSGKNASIGLKEANAKAQNIINLMISDLKMPVIRMFA
jgi:hypothetical protein